jgi:hypothetical protein
MKLGYSYNPNTKHWRNPTDTMSVDFGSFDTLRTVVCCSAETKFEIVDNRETPLTFFATFLENVAQLVSVKNLVLRPDNRVGPYVPIGSTSDEIDHMLSQQFSSWELVTHK